MALHGALSKLIWHIVTCDVLSVGADAHALLSAELGRLEVVLVALAAAVDEVAALARRRVEPVPHELPLARAELPLEVAVRRPLEVLRQRGRRRRQHQNREARQHCPLFLHNSEDSE